MRHRRIFVIAVVALGAGLIGTPSRLLAQEAEHSQPEDAAQAASAQAMVMEGMATEQMTETPAGPPALPEVSDLVSFQLDEEAHELDLVFGPVSLPAGGAHLRSPVQLAELPIEGWLHGFSWEIRDASGTVLPERLLHHVNVIDPDNRELFSAIPRRIIGAGRETASESLPGLLGYRIQAGTRILISAMFASRPDQSFDEAYLHLTLRYTPIDDHGWIRPRDVLPFYLDAMGPVGEKEFPLPPGTHGMKWEGSPAIDGRILGIGGHLHDYADWLRFEDVTTGKLIWEAIPELDEQGRVIGVPTSMLWWRGGVKIHRDHVYRISVQYTNPLDVPTMDGAMGAIAGVILTGNVDWPAFSREDPDYVMDLRNTLEKPDKPHNHGAMPGMADMGAAAPENENPNHTHPDGSDHTPTDGKAS